MEILAVGIITFINLIVLKLKFEQERYLDLAVDVSALIALAWVFGGSIKGLEVAMIAGGLMSITLYIFPPKFKV